MCEIFVGLVYTEYTRRIFRTDAEPGASSGGSKHDLVIVVAVVGSYGGSVRRAS